MKRAYIDCMAGISGDMVLGALIDLGVGIGKLRSELRKLPIDGYTISAKEESRHSITGTRVTVKVKGQQPSRSFRAIRAVIEESSLSDGVRERSCATFRNLAIAEAKIHGCAVDDVHFHEVGAVDSIIDIVGAAIGMEALDIGEVTASPVPSGSGWVNTMHGQMPVPAPATLELLIGIPVTPSPVEREVTTPTGAAILKSVAGGFGTMPEMVVEATGYGVGGYTFEEIPNLLRITVGASGEPSGELVVVETTIDDMNPQIYGHLSEQLLEEGALDVFLTPVYMKKGRPATLLTVLCKKVERGRLTDMIFRETTTLGVRFYGVERECLTRQEEAVKTPYGTVRIKSASRGREVLTVQPEYDDCKRIAETQKVPLRLVMEAAKEAYRSRKR
ncbi:MAG: nickel pincer cofactor biosynthesis protein LarC [Thermodesulfobacteriota bacterium]